MAKLNLKQLGKAGMLYAKTHTAGIAAGIAGVGFLCAIGSAVVATVKSVREVDAIKEENGVSLEPKAVIKACWKNYIPTALFTATGIVGLGYAGAKYESQVKALAASLAMSENAFKEVRDQVIKQIGQDEYDKLIETVHKEEIAKESPEEKDIVTTGYGDQLFKESWTGQYFYSTPEKVREAVNDINYRYRGEEMIPFSDWLDALGLNSCKAGEVYSFDAGKGMIEYYTSAFKTANDRSGLVINYRNRPCLDPYLVL